MIHAFIPGHDDCLRLLPLPPFLNESSPTTLTLRGSPPRDGKHTILSLCLLPRSVLLGFALSTLFADCVVVGRPKDSLYEPALADSEREAVADLLQYLENVR